MDEMKCISHINYCKLKNKIPEDKELLLKSCILNQENYIIYDIITRDKSFFLNLVKKNPDPYFLLNSSDNIKYDEHCILYFFKHYYKKNQGLYKIPNKISDLILYFKDNYNFVKNLVNIYPFLYLYISYRLKQDNSIIFDVLKKNYVKKSKMLHLGTGTFYKHKNNTILFNNIIINDIRAGNLIYPGINNFSSVEKFFYNVNKNSFAFYIKFLKKSILEYTNHFKYDIKNYFYFVNKYKIVLSNEEILKLSNNNILSIKFLFIKESIFNMNLKRINNDLILYMFKYCIVDNLYVKIHEENLFNMKYLIKLLEKDSLENLYNINKNKILIKEKVKRNNINFRSLKNKFKKNINVIIEIILSFPVFLKLNCPKKFLYDKKLMMKIVYYDEKNINKIKKKIRNSKSLLMYIINQNLFKSVIEDALYKNRLDIILEAFKIEPKILDLTPSCVKYDIDFVRMLKSSREDSLKYFDKEMVSLLKNFENKNYISDWGYINTITL